MPLIRVYAKMDTKHKIALPKGIRKALGIKPGGKLELTIVPNGVLLRNVSSGCRSQSFYEVSTFGTGMNKARKLIATKVRRRLAR